MSQDQKSVTSIVAIGAVGAVVVTCLVGMIVLAVRLDGSIADNVLTAFQNLLLALIPCLTGVIGIEAYKTVAVVKSTNAAQVQTAQANAAPAPIPAPDPGAVSSPSIGDSGTDNGITGPNV